MATWIRQLFGSWQDTPRKTTREIPGEDLAFGEVGTVMSVLTGTVKEYRISYDSDGFINGIKYYNSSDEIISSIEIETNSAGKITRVARVNE